MLATTAVTAVHDNRFDQGPDRVARAARVPRHQLMLKFGNGGAIDCLIVRRRTHDRPFLVEKPALWPENSPRPHRSFAEWTAAMRAHHGSIGKPAFVPRYGFGVPSLVRALGSFDHDVTLVS